MFPDYVKSAMDERERSIQDLLRQRRQAGAHPSEARWRTSSRAQPKHQYGRRGL